MAKKHHRSSAPAPNQTNGEIQYDDIYTEDENKRILIFRSHGKNSYFGEEDIIKMNHRSFNAVCVEDTEIYTLDKVVRKECSNFIGNGGAYSTRISKDL